MPWDDDHARAHVGRVETLLTSLDALPDEAARTRALEAAGALADLYGECLARIMARLEPAAAADVATDELVGQLLLVHDLHPVPAEQRIRRALEGTGAELLGVADGVATVRLPRAGGGCGSAAPALAAAVRRAVAAAAPGIERVETAGRQPGPQALIPAEALLAGLRSDPGEPS